MKRRRFCSLPPVHSLEQDVIATMVERFRGIKRTFRNILILGERGEVYQPYFPEADLFLSHHHVIYDDEWLPFRSQTFDLIISHLSWHWVNDLPGVLAQVQDILKPDGLVMAALFGGESLWQLRYCLQEAEQQLSQGISPRIAPMISPADGADLLLRAGFALPVADHDHVTLYYEKFEELVDDLRCYGQTNILYHQHKGIPSKNLFHLTDKIYQHHFKIDGQLPIAVNIIYLTGWRPSPTQPQPLCRGSATVKLSHILATS
jgi:SAM-dependent methyltransferase